MNKSLVAVACLLMCFGRAVAHQDHSVPLRGLSVVFGIVANNYQGKPQSHSALELHTEGSWALPAKGWKIYFNFARQIIPATVTGDVQITHINGDLFCLSPTAAFKGISPGQTDVIEFNSTDWMINITDSPAGFYLVYDNDPSKVYIIDIVSAKPSVNPEQYMRSPLDKVPLATPETIFAQNKNIRNIPADSLVKVFPTPISYHQETGSFVLDKSVQISSIPAFAAEEQYLQQTLNELLVPSAALGKSRNKIITLQQKVMPAEAYELVVTSTGITISALSGAGIFYGIQSLKTLIQPRIYQRKQKIIIVKNVTVTDGPRFPYRAVMLDVARNFQPKQEILKVLDVMSLYKLNVLHFHLTDDEGWRLEIPELPELTTVGAHRGHTLTNQQYLQPALGSGPDVNNPSGSGYYSKADFEEILRYATQRHIRVIPEIESPGHARAAIKSMDARYNNFKQAGNIAEAEKYLLHDLKDTSKYLSVQYWNDNVMDVALPSVYRFVNTVTEAVVKMYNEAGAPLETIHFGGDEVPAGAWQASPACAKLMKTDTSIHKTDDLWLYYYTHVNEILKSHQLYLTAWEETGLVKATVNNVKVNVINQSLSNQNVHLEVWNNVLGWGAEDLAYKQANAGYKVILSCVSNLYFDMAAEKAFEEPGYYWGGYADVDKMFKFIPYNYFKNTTEDRMGNPLNKAALNNKEKLTNLGKANIVGLQGALWGETLKSPQRLEYMLVPKMLGLAERAWAKEPEWATATDSVKATKLYNEAWSVFVNTLGKRELTRLDYYTGGFQYRIPEPGATVENSMVTVNAQYPGFKVFYTTDGSAPTPHSLLYTKPFPYSGNIKMALFDDALRMGRVVDVAKTN